MRNIKDFSLIYEKNRNLEKEKQKLSTIRKSVPQTRKDIENEEEFFRIIKERRKKYYLKRVKEILDQDVSKIKNKIINIR